MDAEDENQHSCWLKCPKGNPIKPDPVKEEILPVIKLSYSLLASGTQMDEKQKCIELSWPHHAEPSKAEYEKEIRELKRLSKVHPEKQYLSI